MKTRMFLALTLAALAGCSAYSWKSSVPEEFRTIGVPVFRNESTITELGPVVTRQVLREFQREGTFTVRHPDDAALEIQGVIRSADASGRIGDRMVHRRNNEYVFTAVAEVSVIDRRNGKVLLDNRRYSALATFTGQQDINTGARNASGRLGEDLARQIVDDVLGMKW